MKMAVNGHVFVVACVGSLPPGCASSNPKQAGGVVLGAAAGGAI